MEASDLKLVYWFSQGWRTYKNNLKRILIAAAVFSSFWWIRWWLTYLPHGALVSRGFRVIVDPPLIAGFSFFCLALTRGKPAGPRTFLAGFSSFGRVWLASFLLMLIVIVGFALLIIPGIIWGLKYGLCVISVLDKELLPLRAIKFSGKITQGYKVRLFLLSIPSLVFAVLLLAFNFALTDLIQSGVGPFIAIAIRIILYLVSNFIISPWLFIAWATAYDALSKRYENVGALSLNK